MSSRPRHLSTGDASEVFPLATFRVRFLQAAPVALQCRCTRLNLPVDITPLLINCRVCLHLVNVALQVSPVPSKGLLLRNPPVDTLDDVPFAFIVIFLVTEGLAQQSILVDAVIIIVLPFPAVRTRLVAPTILSKGVPVIALIPSLVVVVRRPAKVTFLLRVRLRLRVLLVRVGVLRERPRLLRSRPLRVRLRVRLRLLRERLLRERRLLARVRRLRVRLRLRPFRPLLYVVNTNVVYM